MCGVFAYAGSRVPNRSLLTEAALSARRGPHGHGWVSEHGAFYGAGAMDVGTLPTPLVLGSWIVGHSRLATCGVDPHDVTALQPATRGGHVVVHNGTMADGWRDEYPSAHTDSHALADVYAYYRGYRMEPGAALKEAVDAFEHDAWAVIIRDTDGTLLASTRKLPLFGLEIPAWGTYLSSVSFTGATRLNENEVHTWPR